MTAGRDESATETVLTTEAANPFRMDLVVQPDDIDEQGHASNVAILGWMNQAAVAHSAALGYDMAAYQRLGAMFVVRRHEIDYIRSAYEGERIACFTWPSFAKAATAHRRHEIIRISDGQVIARGLNVWAFIDMATGRPVRMPAEVRQAFDPAKFI